MRKRPLRLLAPLAISVATGGVPALAAELGKGPIEIPYVATDACPYEGCVYGTWSVHERAALREAPDSASAVVRELKPGEEVEVLTGEVHVIPGRARVHIKPHMSASDLDPAKEVLILDYLGEGYSRIYQDGRYFSVKIARTKTRCRERPNWRYCWAEVIEEPISHWWVRVAGRAEKAAGWVLVKGRALGPVGEAPDS